MSDPFLITGTIVRRGVNVPAVNAAGLTTQPCIRIDSSGVWFAARPTASEIVDIRDWLATGSATMYDRRKKLRSIAAEHEGQRLANGFAILRADRLGDPIPDPVYAEAVAGSGVDADELEADLTALRDADSTTRQAVASLVTEQHQQWDAIDALRGDLLAAGSAPTPALTLLNLSRDVVVTLSRDMGSTTYQAKPILDGSAVKAGASAVVKSKTATTVTVTVSALVAVGASNVIVIAWP